jgi:serine/threonine protein kinase
MTLLDLVYDPFHNMLENEDWPSFFRRKIEDGWTHFEWDEKVDEKESAKLKEFLLHCLAFDPNTRKSARELLNHSFLDCASEDGSTLLDKKSQFLQLQSQL